MIEVLTSTTLPVPRHTGFTPEALGNLRPQGGLLLEQECSGLSMRGSDTFGRPIGGTTLANLSGIVNGVLGTDLLSGGRTLVFSATRQSGALEKRVVLNELPQQAKLSRQHTFDAYRTVEPRLTK